MGFILAFAPPSAFRLERGEDSLSTFTFNKQVIQHLFCRTCGVESFARGRTPDGTEMVAINVRCLDGVEPASLSPQQVDGRSF
jgi:hypothetical protein